MKAKNPRLTMTLTPTVAAQLRRLSELTGNSQAGLVSELLEGQQHVFSKLIKVLEAAHTAKGELVEGLVESMEKAHKQIESQLGFSLEHLDEGFAPLIDQAEKIKRRSGRATAEGDASASASGGARRVVTPLSNRGVRSDPKTVKSSTRTRV